MATRMTDEEVLKLHIDQRNSKWSYPWDEWLDGGWWLIEEGKDYHIKTKSMRKLIYDKRKRWGGRMIAHCLTQDTILFKWRPSVSNTGT